MEKWQIKQILVVSFVSFRKLCCNLIVCLLKLQFFWERCECAKSKMNLPIQWIENPKMPHHHHHHHHHYQVATLILLMNQVLLLCKWSNAQITVLFSHSSFDMEYVMQIRIWKGTDKKYVEHAPLFAVYSVHKKYNDHFVIHQTHID